MASVDDAIANGDIHFLFQPKYSFKAQGFCGAEALARWRHPDLGSIPPDEFIPVLERHGRLTDLTLHSLATIEPLLRTLADAGQSMHIAVNISAPLLFDATFAAQLEKRVQNMGSIRKMLTLEVTESASFEDDSTGFKLLAKLRQMGCRVSIDDYGTGNSTLSYLRRFPADEIKIDKSFIQGVTQPENRNSAIIAAIVSLATALKMDTTAEGIEAHDELTAMRKLGVGQIQGYIYAPAIGNDDVIEAMLSGDWVIEPNGPSKYRQERRTVLRKVGLIHEDHRYEATMRNLSRSGCMVEGLLDVPLGTPFVVDFGEGQLAVAVVRRSAESRNLARPKSSSFSRSPPGMPGSFTRMMLSGLMSRWTTPFSWARDMIEAICWVKRAACISVMRGARPSRIAARRLNSVSPSRNSIRM